MVWRMRGEATMKYIVLYSREITTDEKYSMRQTVAQFNVYEDEDRAVERCKEVNGYIVKGLDLVMEQTNEPS